MKQVPPRNDESPCLVLCNGTYSEVLPCAEANDLAMFYAAKGQRAQVLRLIEETVYAGIGH
jgi:hypothetical protein